MTTIHSILEEFRKAPRSNRDMGDKFERLIASYLMTDPMYKDKYSEVWLWSDWPLRNNRPDTGIDLVAKDRYSGEYCAIQCKFYDPSYTLQKGDIDSFFTASGKSPFSSRLIVSTTDKWSKHAEDALINQHIPVARMRVQDLADSPVDWSQFSINRPQNIKLRKKKVLREHQNVALNKVTEGFREADRGKLIMACGTGKTFTSLKIAETISNINSISSVLFLVPSISLLSQTLREWTAETETPFNSFAVCSDTKVGKGNDEDISSHDLAFPATTDTIKLVQQYQAVTGQKKLTVIFSTYQSIQVVAEAQKKGLPEFDLIICDEAHRTTGVTLVGQDESNFVRVHNQEYIKGNKRLYMTATPRLFSDDTKTKANENDAILCSMDDESIYGKELHRLGFSEAVGKGLLSDYKVMVLAVDEKHVSKTFQSQIADTNSEINLEDAVKITGCWNGLSKRFEMGEYVEKNSSPMRRAVAFSRSIKDSKRLTELFSQIIDEYYLQNGEDANAVSCEVEHVDGTFNALKRNEKLDWLKEDTTSQGNVCRILSNARCLTEGVDVPDLDAVMFLNPRNSVVDVVQSVGRVMRKAEGKEYGYIILPIGVPADMEPEEALKNNQKYKVVWQVLQALRAHDDRFNTTVNQIELNKSRPNNIQIIGVGGEDEDNKEGNDKSKTKQLAFGFPNLDEWRDAIYAKIVLKCGDRRYWESWAKDVAEIAERHTTRIKALLEGSDPQHRIVFEEFLKGLRDNLNPDINEATAIEMLSQHLITKPVFDALFEGYQFTKHNPVSVTMQKMLDVLEGQALEKETISLDKFYASVKERATGIDNTVGKQKIVIELYDKFFRSAFPRMAERLGIVYTPVEVVDFIIKSVDDALRKEFGVGVSNSGIHVLDPFTGTGTFMVRLLQSGLINPEDLAHKYKNELHANEIILLAYYIAAINIEETYHGLIGGEYQPFEGIVLTDTFQMMEGKGTLEEKMFSENNQRVVRQNENDIRVIIGNPPYSSGQNNENDGNKNNKYPYLDESIRQSYAKHSSATLKNSLYDSYIRAFRWASNRIKDKGIVCYVSNGSFIDNNSMDGFRKCLEDEYTSIYCFNLRGNQRTSGEQSRKEGGKIFGSGSRTPVAITLLIKNPEKKGKSELFYYDIGDYLNREDKLKIINDFGSLNNIKWNKITPNNNYDWINQRDPAFDGFKPIGIKDENSNGAIFNIYSNGIDTSRDVWTYNFSKKDLTSNMQRMITFYNRQVEDYRIACSGKTKEHFPGVEDFIDNDPKKISWSRGLKADLSRFTNREFSAESIVRGSYRPFCKQWMYFDKHFNNMVYRIPKFFPTDQVDNLVICTSGIGASKDFSALLTDSVPNRHYHDTGQCFPLYTYDKVKELGGLFDQEATIEEEKAIEFEKKENISDSILAEFKKTYDSNICKEDIFYYVYGVLNSKEYKERFAADLKKMLPRIPFAQDFWAFSNAGRELAYWHLNHEIVEPYPLQEQSDFLEPLSEEHYRVQKMKFGKHKGKIDKTNIIYNSQITLSGIPIEAYEYVVNGKSAIEWIMERYQLTKNKDSFIINDPNNWSVDPKYILNQVKRIVRVSVETMKIVNGLPAFNEKLVKNS
ncbi:putative helicase [Peribacillus frigoritolerans]|uniref:DEAD/DEAH box helicase n=1 Tax=Peribacillus frigoritolerans TaxID=450367 RepID=UPI003835FF1D